MFTWEIMSSLFKNPNQSKDPVVIMKEIISWLFKDPINSGLAQFGHAQSSRIQSYEDVQYMGPKWPISPNNFFFRKIC